MINTDKTLLLHYNVDSQGNTMAVKIDNENKQVSPVHYAVQLQQVPDEQHRMVVIDDKSNELIEVFNMDEVGENNYYINYTSSVVYFHPTKAGKTFIFNYHGLGIELIGASRIYDESSLNGKFIVRTLQEIIDKGRECIDALSTIGDAVKLLKRIENYIVVATELDIKLRNDIAIGQPLHVNLTNDISTGTQLNKDLGSKITTGTTLKNDLDNRIATANTSKTNLENATTTADAKKKELDTSIVDAQNDINTINSAGNRTYTIPASAWTGTEPNLTYVLNHGLKSENLVVKLKTTSTKDSLPDDTKTIDSDNILIRSTVRQDITAVVIASYYSGKDANTVSQEVIDARKSEISLKSKIDKIDTSLFTLNNEVTAISDEIVIAKGSNLTLGKRLDKMDLDITDRQTKTDNNLTTNNKTIVGAINEKQNKTDNTLVTTSKDITGAINENTDKIKTWETFKSNGGEISGILKATGFKVGSDDIVSYGSNSNGEYIRFYNGIQICMKTVGMSGIGCTKAWGNMYESGQLSLGNWATIFLQTPTLNITLKDSQAGFIEMVNNTTNVAVGHCTVARPSYDEGLIFKFDIIAIGKWK